MLLEPLLEGRFLQVAESTLLPENKCAELRARQQHSQGKSTRIFWLEVTIGVSATEHSVLLVLCSLIAPTLNNFFTVTLSHLR
jgi:hypothetical protein